MYIFFICILNLFFMIDGFFEVKGEVSLSVIFENKDICSVDFCSIDGR